MPMTPFLERLPEVGACETRSVTVTGRQDLPNGEYGFVEFYCDEPGCDCRRVMIDVLRPETGWSKIWATISYGWESLDFYRKWSRAGSDPIEMKGPYLDPLNPQTKYSAALLNLFRFLVQSPDYADRLQRHSQCSARLWTVMLAATIARKPIELNIGGSASAIPAVAADVDR